MRVCSALLSVWAGLYAWAGLAQSPAEMVEPQALVAELASSHPPLVISVAFPVLYRNKHIPHAVEAGPGSKPERLEALKQTVAKKPKNTDIVIYCGCCPMDKCPNFRPAYRALKDMGFEHVRVLNIPTNMSADWYAHGYPAELGSAALGH